MKDIIKKIVSLNVSNTNKTETDEEQKQICTVSSNTGKLKILKNIYI